MPEPRPLGNELYDLSNELNFIIMRWIISRLKCDEENCKGLVIFALKSSFLFTIKNKCQFFNDLVRNETKKLISFTIETFTRRVTVDLTLCVPRTTV